MISEAAIMDLDPAAGARIETVDLVLVRARGGDRAAFEDLLRRHERLVFGTACRLLGAVEDAEDAAQEVFLKLYHHLGRLDPARPLAAWLYPGPNLRGERLEMHCWGRGMALFPRLSAIIILPRRDKR